MNRFKKFLEDTGSNYDYIPTLEVWEEDVFGPIEEVLKQVDGKWAVVSKTTGKPLVYYKGEGKPSDDWFAKQERRINYFKHLNK
jgi:hypothetical protein